MTAVRGGASRQTGLGVVVGLDQTVAGQADDAEGESIEQLGRDDCERPRVEFAEREGSLTAL